MNSSAKGRQSWVTAQVASNSDCRLTGHTQNLTITRGVFEQQVILAAQWLAFERYIHAPLQLPPQRPSGNAMPIQFIHIQGGLHVALGERIGVTRHAMGKRTRFHRAQRGVPGQGSGGAAGVL